jgi:hypothetical protein
VRDYIARGMTDAESALAPSWAAGVGVARDGNIEINGSN